MKQVRTSLSNAGEFRIVYEDKRNLKYGLVVYEKTGTP